MLLLEQIRRVVTHYSKNEKCEFCGTDLHEWQTEPEAAIHKLDCPIAHYLQKGFPMCDSATRSKIEEACADLVGKNMMFTALDVTKKVWELLGNDTTSRWPHGYHSSIKNDTHSVMRSYVDGGSYEKANWNVGAPVSAILYFPTGSDPNSYVPGTANIVAPTAVSAPDSDDGDDTDGDNDDYDAGAAQAQQQLAADGKVTPDVHCQLHVPCEFLRKAGFGPKDIAYAIQKLDPTGQGKADVLVLVKHAPAPPVASYHVDYHGAVRLSRRTLTTVWPVATAGTYFSFDATSDEVVVSLG